MELTMNPSRCVEFIEVRRILKNSCDSVLGVNPIEFLNRSSYTYVLQVQPNFVANLVAMWYIPFVIYIAFLSLLCYCQSRLGKVLGFSKLCHNILYPSDWIEARSNRYNLAACY
jgi:hypothetical protein